MRLSLNLHFLQRKPQHYQTGDLPIYLRITLEGQRTELTINRKFDPKRWNAKIGRANGKSVDAKALNSFMEQIKTKILDIHSECSNNDELITIETLKDKFLGKEEKSRTLVNVFEIHNQKMESLIGKEFEKCTLQKYKTCLSHLKDFIVTKYKIKDIALNKVSFEFLNEFEYYLKSIRHCGSNSTHKYLKNLGKVIRICLGNGWLLVNPFLNYKPKTKKVHRQVLTNDELQTIYQKQFTIERLQLVKDIFLFSCYTGLAYADVKKLKRSELATGVDGNLWIHSRRQKTDTMSRIPILPIALSVLKAYENHPQCLCDDHLLPVLSNQKMNAYLKEIADICQIDKPLTFHIARHTFATTITLNNGVPIETLSKMMGHTSIKTTQIYAKVLDHKISEDMLVLKGKLT